MNSNTGKHDSLSGVGVADRVEAVEAEALQVGDCEPRLDAGDVVGAVVIEDADTREPAGEGLQDIPEVVVLL